MTALYALSAGVTASTVAAGLIFESWEMPEWVVVYLIGIGVIYVIAACRP